MDKIDTTIRYERQKMTIELMDDIYAHLKEIENLKGGILNNLNTITSGNLSHRICFSKHLASEIGVECKRLRSKVKNILK